MVYDLGFRVSCLGVRIFGLGFMFLVYFLGFRV
jgi:hypothetical protein